MLQNENLIAKIGADTTENASKFAKNFGKLPVCTGPGAAGRSRRSRFWVIFSAYISALSAPPKKIYSAFRN